MALPGVRHSSRRSPSWLCEQSVMALGRIRHLWRLASISQSQSLEVTDSSQSNDRLLLEPWQTPGRAMTDFWQTQRSYFLNLRNSKTRLKLCQNLFWRKQQFPKLRKKTVHKSKYLSIESLQQRKIIWNCGPRFGFSKVQTYLTREISGLATILFFCSKSTNSLPYKKNLFSFGTERKHLFM